ncbi:hypothetical protein RclHR1_00020056 [Rhizophagus clarus]|uniref:F-box domain-containing protein n=1 Tax=Rhizophagus clarus TaxID=94130 RepID=A0A2Z6QPN0_9GLOM|nr:hypothetical protein RclHR1_00020056 [Rhizophagus clarus]GES80187.1 hypothetical protein GLOIN_2v1769546 [Rhizophagus clarus]
MSKLIPDIFDLIIRELGDDYGALFSCLLVNKLWCKLTIPILWRDCLGRKPELTPTIRIRLLIRYGIRSLLREPHEKKILLVKILFTFLSEESKNLLIENGIDLSFIPTQKPLFNYLCFCKSIATFDVAEYIKGCFDPPLSKDQEQIMEEEFNNMLFSQCSYLSYLKISHENYKKHEIILNLRLKDNLSLSNIVELVCGQYVDEKFFYSLAETCVNIRKLELKGNNRNDNQGLIKLIEVQNKLEYFIYSGNNGRNWDEFCEKMGQTLIKHKNTIKHIEAKSRLCIPLSILNSFVNLESLMLGYSTSTMNGLHSVKLPKLQILRVCYLTEVKELIQNTSGYLKTIKIHNQKAENLKAEDLIQVINAIYQNCPKLEYLCIPYANTIDDALGDLFINCNQLKDIEIYDGYPDDPLNGDIVLKILLKTNPKKLQRIEMKGEWNFSVEGFEEFLDNLEERNYSIYFRFGLNHHIWDGIFSDVFEYYVYENVLKTDPLNYL